MIDGTAGNCSATARRQPWCRPVRRPIAPHHSLCWSDSFASRRRGDVGALVGLAEETLADKLFEQHLAGRNIYLPQTTRLRERQSQPWHFPIFTANTSDEGIKRRRIAPVAKILSTGPERSLHSSRSARNQSSHSWPGSPPRSSKSWWARRAISSVCMEVTTEPPEWLCDRTRSGSRYPAGYTTGPARPRHPLQRR
jgi:hypothetical protein